MARTTITDVREELERLNKSAERELALNSWGQGKYQIVEIDSPGEANVSPVMIGASAAMTFLRGYAAGLNDEEKVYA